MSDLSDFKRRVHDPLVARLRELERERERAQTYVKAPEQMRALLDASREVREGRWIKGAATHVLADLLKALEKNGWGLVRISDKPASSASHMLDTSHD